MLWRRARQYTNVLILNFNFNLAGHQDETLADDNIKQFLLECKKWLSVYKNSKHECANYNCKSRYKKGGVTGVLPIWIVSLTFTSVGPLSEKNISLANARNVRLYLPYRQYTNLFIFRFVSQHCPRSTRFISVCKL